MSRRGEIDVQMTERWKVRGALIHSSVRSAWFQSASWEETGLLEFEGIEPSSIGDHLIARGADAWDQAELVFKRTALSQGETLNDWGRFYSRQFARIFVPESFGGGVLWVAYMNQVKARLSSPPPLRMLIDDSSFGEHNVRLDSVVFYGGTSPMRRLIAERAWLQGKLSTSVCEFAVTPDRRALQVSFARELDVIHDIWTLVVFAVDHLRSSHSKTEDGFTMQQFMYQNECVIRNGRAVQSTFRPVSREEYFGSLQRIDE
jgi:hypothetical protein